MTEVHDYSSTYLLGSGLLRAGILPYGGSQVQLIDIGNVQDARIVGMNYPSEVSQLIFSTPVNFVPELVGVGSTWELELEFPTGDIFRFPTALLAAQEVLATGELTTCAEYTWNLISNRDGFWALVTQGTSKSSLCSQENSLQGNATEGIRCIKFRRCG
jgi:hypothetical protein